MIEGWILGLDTATRATAVALAGPDGELFEARDDRLIGERPQHAAQLLPLCAEVLDRVGRSFAEVDGLAVGIGPGTFTGLRIGVATARALARAREIPLVGVSSLEALAAGAAVTADGAAGEPVVLAVIDARRGEAFVAAWRGEERVLEPRALRPEALALEVERIARTSGPAPLAIGDGALRFTEQLEVAGAAVPPPDSRLHRISAINHCRLAAGLPATSPARVEPVYLRAPDAEIAYRERHRGPK